MTHIEDKIIQVDKEETIKMKIMREVGVDLEKASIQKIIEEMTELAVVDLDQVQDLM